MEQIEAGNIRPPTRTSRSMIAYVRAINLKVGDEQQFTIAGPDGSIIATHAGTPMATSLAQRFVFIGKNRPAAGWQSGQYRGNYAVLR
jgi:hypothetical protein